MKVRKKLTALLGATVMAAAVMFAAGGTVDAKAAASYKVDCSTGDVSAYIGETVEIPVTVKTEQKLRGFLGKLKGNYDETVLEFEGLEKKDLPEKAMVSTAGGNFSYLTSAKDTTFSEATFALKFKVLKYVDYDEVFQMAEKGAKVIHPRAVELAKNADIILQIKNTYNPNYEGTKIGPANVLKDVYEDSSKVKFMSAVAHKDKIAQVKVIATEDIFSRILNEMEDRHINMDMINFFTEKKAFALDVSNLEEVENILKQYDIEYEIKPDCAKVTLIGNKVTETPGVIAKIMRALNAENVTLLQSSDSYNSLSCLVDEKDMVTTVHVIHNAFSV